MTPTTLSGIVRLVEGRTVRDPHLQAVVDRVETDSRQVAPGTLFAALGGENVDGHDFIADAFAAGATAAIVSRRLGELTPEIRPRCIEVDDVMAALSQLARYQIANTSALVVALTGSQGKTSVKDILAHILSSAGATVASVGSFNNELGVPLTVLRTQPDTKYLVLEMGARGIGHIAWLCQIAQPAVAAVLNVGSSHIGEFGSVEAIAQAKGELVESLQPDGVAVLNVSDPRTAAMADRTDAAIMTFGESGVSTGAAADVELSHVRLDETGQAHFTLTYCDEQITASVPQLGRHVATNAAAAVAIAIAAGVPFDAAAAQLATAHPASPMRMQRSIRADGVTIINDAYNANPESMTASLEAVAEIDAGRRVAVLGHMLELGPLADQAHRDVGKLAAALGFDRVIAVGPLASEIAVGAGEIGETVADPESAVTALTAWLTGGDVVVVKASRGCRLERVADALLTQATKGATDR